MRPQLFGILPILLLHSAFSDNTADKKLLILVIDGLPWNKLDEATMPNFAHLRDEGTKVEYLKPVFPTVGYPNYYSLFTGLYPEEHGIVDEYMYDGHGNIFDNGIVQENSSDVQWFQNGELFWTTTQNNGRPVAIYGWQNCSSTVGPKPTICSTGNASGSDELAESYDFLDQAINQLANDIDVAIIFMKQLHNVGKSSGLNSYLYNKVLTNVDEFIGYAQNRLQNASLWTANMIILSTHGLSQLSRPPLVVDISRFSEDLKNAITYFSGPRVVVYPKEGSTVRVFNNLYRRHPHVHAYWKWNMPAKWRIRDGRYTPSIMVLADPGWTVAMSKKEALSAIADRGAFDGYDPDKSDDMRGVFVALGPNFKKNHTHSPVDIVDIYNLFCHLMDVQPSKNSGQWSNVVDMLEKHPVSSSTAKPHFESSTAVEPLESSGENPNPDNELITKNQTISLINDTFELSNQSAGRNETKFQIPNANETVNGSAEGILINESLINGSLINESLINESANGELLINESQLNLSNGTDFGDFFNQTLKETEETENGTVASGEGTLSVGLSNVTSSNGTSSESELSNETFLIGNSSKENGANDNLSNRTLSEEFLSAGALSNQTLSDEFPHSEALSNQTLSSGDLFNWTISNETLSVNWTTENQNLSSPILSNQLLSGEFSNQSLSDETISNHSFSNKSTIDKVLSEANQSSTNQSLSLELATVETLSTQTVPEVLSNQTLSNETLPTDNSPIHTATIDILSNGTLFEADILSNGTLSAADILSNGTLSAADILSNGTLSAADILSNGTLLEANVSNETQFNDSLSNETLSNAVEPGANPLVLENGTAFNRTDKVISINDTSNTTIFGHSELSDETRNSNDSSDHLRLDDGPGLDEHSKSKNRFIRSDHEEINTTSKIICKCNEKMCVTQQNQIPCFDDQKIDKSKSDQDENEFDMRAEIDVHDWRDTMANISGRRGKRAVEKTDDTDSTGEKELGSGESPLASTTNKVPSDNPDLSVRFNHKTLNGQASNSNLAHIRSNKYDFGGGIFVQNKYQPSHAPAIGESINPLNKFLNLMDPTDQGIKPNHGTNPDNTKVRLNQFNVASGGQATQFILQQPVVNVIVPQKQQFPYKTSNEKTKVEILEYDNEMGI